MFWQRWKNVNGLRDVINWVQIKTDCTREHIKQKILTNLFKEFFTYTEKRIYYDKISRTSNKYFVRMWTHTHTLDTRLKHRAQTLSISNEDPNQTHQVLHLKTWCICSLCDICAEEGIMFIHSLFPSDDAIIKIKILANCKREGRGPINCTKTNNLN